MAWTGEYKSGWVCRYWGATLDAISRSKASARKGICEREPFCSRAAKPYGECDGCKGPVKMVRVED